MAGRKTFRFPEAFPSGRDTDFADSRGSSPELRDHSCNPCLTPDSPQPLGVGALEPNAQMVSQMLGKRLLLRAAAPQLLFDDAQRLAHVVKPPLARTGRAGTLER